LLVIIKIIVQLLNGAEDNQHTFNLGKGSPAMRKLIPFFLEDKPSMMTPKQVLGMESVGNTKIKEPPKYINYQ
jgi:hypothetical protein